MSDRHDLEDGMDGEAAGLDRVTATLRYLPPVAPSATDRIVAAALARQRELRTRRAWMTRAAAVVLAAGVGGAGWWYGRRSATDDRHATVASAPVPATESSASAAVPVNPAGGRVTFAATGAGDEAPVTVPFALLRPNARRVALVGDFDAWSPTKYPMHRASDGTWTVTVELTPGRHAYAFVVDDSVWVTDPRAEVVHDPDYGRDHSVLIVGRP